MTENMLLVQFGKQMQMKTIKNHTYGSIRKYKTKSDCSRKTEST